VVAVRFFAGLTSKVVLVLGRFTPDRKVVLDAIRDELRKRDYAPVLFDFEKPSSRDITETVRTLVHMARFVIADITAAARLLGLRCRSENVVVFLHFHRGFT
jgi:hypothetical protein